MLKLRMHYVLLLTCIFLFSIPSNVSSQAISCPYKNFGDANCDNKITSDDFSIWTNEFLKKSTTREADFSQDTAISLIDLEILIRASLRGLPTLSGSPAPTTVAATSTPPITSGSITPTGIVPTSVNPSQTPVPTTQAPSPTIAPGATLPAQVLNLTNWKQTLPIGEPEDPTEIEQPALALYRLDPWFVVTSDGQGVRFRAPVNGVTTSGSGYPRSELREMANNGQDQASWTSFSGIHTMTIDQAITHLPDIKKHVVAGQIHDGGDDVIVIRLEGTKLFVDINGDDGPILTNNYALGTRFTVKFEVSNGQTRIYYNGTTVNNTGTNTPFALIQDYEGAYFKAGAYTQSKCIQDEGEETNCSANNFGEVIIYGLTVTHQ